MFDMLANFIGLFVSFFSLVGRVLTYFIDIVKVFIALPGIVLSFLNFMPVVLMQNVMMGITLGIGLRIASFFIGSGKND